MIIDNKAKNQLRTIITDSITNDHHTQIGGSAIIAESLFIPSKSNGSVENMRSIKDVLKVEPVEFIRKAV
jgi:hypothetical protein